MQNSLRCILLILITRLICLKSDKGLWWWWCNTSLLSDQNVCHCGNVTYDDPYLNWEAICLDSSTCEVDTLGNVTCPNGIVEIEPVFFGGKCNVHDWSQISVPCQEESGEVICEFLSSPIEVCKGFSFCPETSCSK